MPDEQERVKQCPFSQKWCEKGVCALWVEFGQRVGGMQRTVGMCVFVGSNQILSEMNMHLAMQGQRPMPRLEIAGMGRG